MNEEIMKAVGFEKEVNLVKLGKCPLCSNPVLKGSFRDALSEREFSVSGMCQSCQDDVFGEFEG